MSSFSAHSSPWWEENKYADVHIHVMKLRYSIIKAQENCNQLQRIQDTRSKRKEATSTHKAIVSQLYGIQKSCQIIVRALRLYVSISCLLPCPFPPILHCLVMSGALLGVECRTRFIAQGSLACKRIGSWVRATLRDIISLPTGPRFHPLSLSFSSGSLSC